jgi:hypothetical protein
MNWEAMGAIAESVGAVGVIVTLLYLSRQVRNNTKALRVQSYDAIQHQFREWNSPFYNDPDLVKQFVTQLEDIESLDALGQHHAVHIFYDFFKMAENLHYQYRQGMIDEGMWSGWRTLFENYMSAPGSEWYWRRRPDFFAPEFQEWVEETLANKPESRRHGRVPGQGEG